MGCQTMIQPKIYLEPDIYTNNYSYKNNRIWYDDTGEGEIMLFIHGFASSAYTWRYLKDYYSKTHRVISIDLKGFGRSSKPVNDSYKLEEHSAMILDFINKKELKNITLVGHSFGGAIVLSSYIDAEAELKANIKRIILINSAAYKQNIPGYIAILRTPLLNDISLNLLSNESSTEFILKELVYDDSIITQEMITTYGGYLKDPNAQNALKKSAANIIPENIDHLTSQYKDITIPVLIIWGEQDTVIDKDIGKRLHGDIMESTFVSIENCGHIPQEETPGDTIKIIDRFID